MIDHTLLRSCAADLGITLSEPMLARFDTFAAMLIRENEKYNLTAITDPDGIVKKHFIDSLALLPLFGYKDGDRLLDVGAGAGFPGIPLLIAADGGLEGTLIDARQKRVAFMESVLGACGLNGAALCARAEELGGDEAYREQYDIVTARAVAPLPLLCELCLPLVKVGGSFWAMKGASDETQDAAIAVSILGGRTEDVITYRLPDGDARSVIRIRKISQTPTAYPRKYKKMQTKPL